MFKSGELDPDLQLDTNFDETIVRESKIIWSPIIQKKDGEIFYHKFFTEESEAFEKHVNVNASPEETVDI